MQAEVDGIVPRVAYYEPGGEGWHRLDTLADLQLAFDRVRQGTPTWTKEMLEAVEHDAATIGADDVVRLHRTFDLDIQGDRLALEERGRDILLRAARVELALGQQSELMGSDYPWEFGPGAIDGLRRHKYPWAPLLQLVEASDLSPAAADAYQQELAGEPPERLRRRFAALADDAKQLLRQLAEPRGEFIPQNPASGSSTWVFFDRGGAKPSIWIAMSCGVLRRLDVAVTRFARPARMILKLLSLFTKQIGVTRRSASGSCR